MLNDTVSHNFKAAAGSPPKSNHSILLKPQIDEKEDSLPSLMPKTWTAEEAQLFLKNRKWRITAQQRRINELEGEVADFREDAEKAGIRYSKARYSLGRAQGSLEKTGDVQTSADKNSSLATEGSKQQAVGEEK